MNDIYDITGFEICEFGPDPDGICERCNESNVQLYYRRTCYWNEEGDYYCKKCVAAEAMSVEDDIATQDGCTCDKWKREQDQFRTFVKQEGKWHIRCGNHPSWIRKIAHCPMCGKKLGRKIET